MVGGGWGGRKVLSLLNQINNKRFSMVLPLPHQEASIHKQLNLKYSCEFA